MVSVKEKYGYQRKFGDEKFYFLKYSYKKSAAQEEASSVRKYDGRKARVIKGKHPQNGKNIWIVYTSWSLRKKSVRADKKPKMHYKSATYSKRMSEKMSETWNAFWNLKGTWYEVIKSGTGSAYARGTSIPWFRTRSRDRAIKFFKSHPKAIAIQKYKGRMTAGLVDVFPKTVRERGMTYRLAYRGPHTKAMADKLLKGFKRDGIAAVKRKAGKHGWLVYVGLK